MTRAVISAWSAVSPFGTTSASFAAGVAAGGSTVAELDPQEWDVPEPRAHLVPGFDIQEVLGRKGTRAMDRVSALAVTAVRELLEDAPRNREVGTGNGAALVLGTTTGSAKSMMDITRDTLIHDKPFYIDAARVPNAIMNSASAQCAIRHQLKGPNATVAGGRVAGLFALRYAMRLLAAGRAGAVLCGGAEEFSAARAWLEHHGRTAGEPTQVLGEGCAVLLVEPADPEAESAEVLTVELGVYTPGDLAPALADCIRRALDLAGITVDQVWAISASPPPGPLGDAERAALDQVLGAHRPLAVPGGRLWGDAGAVTATFQIAAALSLARRTPDSRGGVVLVTSVDRDGVLGCALLRVD